MLNAPQDRSLPKSLAVCRGPRAVMLRAELLEDLRCAGEEPFPLRLLGMPAELQQGTRLLEGHLHPHRDLPGPGKGAARLPVVALGAEEHPAQ